jgi:hypothetical protein
VLIAPPARRSGARRKREGPCERIDDIRFAAAGKSVVFLTANSDAVGGRSFLPASAHEAPRDASDAPGNVALAATRARRSRASRFARVPGGRPPRDVAQRQAAHAHRSRRAARLPAACAALKPNFDRAARAGGRASARSDERMSAARAGARFNIGIRVMK